MDESAVMIAYWVVGYTALTCIFVMWYGATATHRQISRFPNWKFYLLITIWPISMFTFLPLWTSSRNETYFGRIELGHLDFFLYRPNTVAWAGSFYDIFDSIVCILTLSTIRSNFGYKFYMHHLVKDVVGKTLEEIEEENN